LQQIGYYLAVNRPVAYIAAGTPFIGPAIKIESAVLHGFWLITFFGIAHKWKTINKFCIGHTAKFAH
jgi:hypothetical protein